MLFSRPIVVPFSPAVSVDGLLGVVDISDGDEWTLRKMLGFE
jgi:hypothetical protein